MLTKRYGGTNLVLRVSLVSICRQNLEVLEAIFCLRQFYLKNSKLSVTFQVIAVTYSFLVVGINIHCN